MYTKMCPWQVLFGISILAFGSGFVLCLPKYTHEAADLRRLEMRKAFLARPDLYKVHAVAHNGNLDYGFFVTRATDVRTREDVCNSLITERNGVVAVLQVLGRSMDDPSQRVRCADCELIGDPVLISELLEFAIAQVPPAEDTR